MCCHLLATSFNFTSSICHLLMFNFNRNPANKNTFLTDKNLKASLEVLNTLTFDNKLFSIDIYVKQLIEFLVEKM